MIGLAPRDPVEDTSMDWSRNPDEENARNAEIEAAAVADIKACGERWRTWLLDSIYGPDGSEVARYITCAMNAHVTGETDESRIARGEQASIGTRLQNDYIAYCVESGQ